MLDIIGTPAKRHLNGVSLEGLRWLVLVVLLDPLAPHQLKKEEKRCQSCRVGFPLTKLSEYAHDFLAARRETLTLLHAKKRLKTNLNIHAV